LITPPPRARSGERRGEARPEDRVHAQVDFLEIRPQVLHPSVSGSPDLDVHPPEDSCWVRASGQGVLLAQEEDLDVGAPVVQVPGDHHPSPRCSLPHTTATDASWGRPPSPRGSGRSGPRTTAPRFSSAPGPGCVRVDRHPIQFGICRAVTISSIPHPPFRDHERHRLPPSWVIDACTVPYPARRPLHASRADGPRAFPGARAASPRPSRGSLRFPVREPSSPLPSPRTSRQRSALFAPPIA